MKQHNTHGQALEVRCGLLFGEMRLHTSMAFDMHQCTTKRTSGLSMPACVTCLENLEGIILSTDLPWYFWRRRIPQHPLMTDRHDRPMEWPRRDTCIPHILSGMES